LYCLRLAALLAYFFEGYKAFRRPYAAAKTNMANRMRVLSSMWFLIYVMIINIIHILAERGGKTCGEKQFFTL
jgi:hypothetical protein